jgi:hypothetical protein
MIIAVKKSGLQITDKPASDLKLMIAGSMWNSREVKLCNGLIERTLTL